MITETASQNMRLGMVGAALQQRYASIADVHFEETSFARDGAVAFPIPQPTVETLRGYFRPENELLFSEADVAHGYIGSVLSADIVENLNKQNVFFGTPDSIVQDVISDYLDFLKDEIKSQLSYDFSVINVRAWITNANASYGPSAWHFDGELQFFLPKLMIYTISPNPLTGTIEFFTRDGCRYVLSAQAPAAILLDSSSLLHRGRSSHNSARPMIEITLAPATCCRTKAVFAGQNARYPLAHVEEIEKRLTEATTYPQAIVSNDPVRPLAAKDVFLSVKDDGFRPDLFNNASALNIGGGRNFRHPGWVNFDEFPPDGVVPVKLSEDRPFPLPTSSMQIVYSSHCLEHLEEGAIVRCLHEARRVLRNDGSLVIKLPDFDAAIAAYQANNAAYFAGNWGLEAIVDLWRNRGMPDCIDTRASIVFCGFWNRSYGHAFREGAPTTFPQSNTQGFVLNLKRRIGMVLPANDAPYHGPAVMPLKALRRILGQSSPSKISSDLTRYVMSNEKDYTFNHRTAFSKEEFCRMAYRCGFKITASDALSIKSRHDNIPGINEMASISAYYELKKLDDRKFVR